MTKFTCKVFKQFSMLRVFILTSILFCSCVKEKESSKCDKLNADSLEILTGVVSIDTKGQMLMEIKNSSPGLKTRLFPCSNDLKEYMESYYNSFLYLHRQDEKFWIRVDGEYLVKPDSIHPPEFLFNFIAILDGEQELKNDSLITNN